MSLRGNKFDDDLSDNLLELLQCNNVLQELDLGENKLGFNCCFALAEGLESNYSLKYLSIDNNRLANAGTAPMEAFVKGLIMNYTMTRLNLEVNGA